MRIKTAFALLCASAAAAAALALPAPATAAPGSVLAAPACGWQGLFSVTTTNEDLLDGAAGYWLLRFTVEDGLQIASTGVIRTAGTPRCRPTRRRPLCSR